MRARICSVGLWLVAVGAIWSNSAFAGPTAADMCEARKVAAAGKYSVCRLKAVAKATKTGDPPDYGKCGPRLEGTFLFAETKGAGVCPTQGDAGAIEAMIDGDSAGVAAALADPVLAGCGDAVKNGTEDCDSADLGGQTCAGLGFPGGTLGCLPTCRFNVMACQGNFPATGQTMSYTPGDDGYVQAGATMNYVDNGDGTITDLNTGLMWEKKWQDGGLHDVDNAYKWTPGAGSIWEWVGFVNAEGGTGFAGHNDWRIPNAKELQSIVDYGVASPGPTVDAVFNSACVASCTMTTCSCTASYDYWSSTTLADHPSYAWFVYFSWGGVRPLKPKNDTVHVRAVRGGL